MALQSFQDGIADLNRLYEEADEEFSENVGRYRARLQKTDEAEMLRIVHRMYMYAREKYEDKTKEVQARMQEKNQIIRKKYMDKRDTRTEEWQKAQDSIYRDHKAAMEAHYCESLPRSSSNSKSDPSSLQSSSMDDPYLCTSICCRSFYIPSELPSKMRCS